MDDLELIFTMLGKSVKTEISQDEKPDFFTKIKYVAKRWRKATGNVRNATEKELGRSVITKKNYLSKSEKKKQIEDKKDT